ncbi:thermonuclease family protein [Hyphomicrobium sp.]|uniref:thermonuclease family protein n=1 Tax=Hyphomicrobium sp. TaxID=82 RepID=UPI0025C5B8C1|nr:thermonuclease family protein [Hyphomicrobium sp.]MCC7254072.1 thermonuclease family protein [Hyphomicrobium sp.]
MMRAVWHAQIAGIVVLSSLLAPVADACAPEAGSSHGVLKVIDGETLLLDDGQEVRLIGALAPKPDVPSQDAADWPPAREARQALDTLVAGRSVQLRYEVRRRDRYGRMLAQVHVTRRDDASADDAVWLQERLIRDGHARAYALPGNAGCIGALMAAEAAARAARRGLWRRDAYRVRDADDVGALLKLAGRFAIVEGRVAEVTRAQRTTYVNFGADWRRDFTASLANTIVDRSDGGAARMSGLKGKTIRVRGWIERRNGPMIALSAPDEIEVLDEVGEVARP